MAFMITAALLIRYIFHPEPHFDQLFICKLTENLVQ